MYYDATVFVKLSDFPGYFGLGHNLRNLASFLKSPFVVCKAEWKGFPCCSGAERNEPVSPQSLPDRDFGRSLSQYVLGNRTVVYVTEKYYCFYSQRTD